MPRKPEAETDRYVITLTGSHGGTLDCRSVKTEDEIANAVKDIAINTTFSHGDSINIIDTQHPE